MRSFDEFVARVRCQVLIYVIRCVLRRIVYIGLLFRVVKEVQYLLLPRILNSPSHYRTWVVLMWQIWTGITDGLLDMMPLFMGVFGFRRRFDKRLLWQ